MKSEQSSEMRPAEKLLVSLTKPPWCAAYLVPAGFLIFPIYHYFVGDSHSGSVLALVFFGVLLVIRFGPVFVRRLIPVSREVQAGWFQNRILAKRYDSYQWQKLFWIGLGIFGYAASFGELGGMSTVLAAICVLVGGVAAIVWRKRRLAIRERELSPR
jgi:hypothetical protein